MDHSLEKLRNKINLNFDESKDAFISPEPSPSGSGTWVLNEDTCRWEHSG